MRRDSLRTAIRIEILTVVWMIVEGAASIAVGISAGSMLLVAFGIDSVLELLSGAILLWRLTVEAAAVDLEQVERMERRAAWLVGICLSLLCVYVLVTAVHGLLSGAKPDSAPAGIVVAIAAVIAMPWLAMTKRRLAQKLHSAALRADAASSLTCGYMAATVLVGLVLNSTLHWWWAEDVAALVFLYWLIQETRETFEESHVEAH